MIYDPRPECKNLASAHKKAGKVKRFHAEQTIQTQTVSDHVYNILRIYVSIWGPPSEPHLLSIIYHDFEEVYLGDLPHWSGRIVELKQAYRKAEADVRSMFPEMPSGDKFFRVKVCDYIDTLEFILTEVMFGNHNMKDQLERLYKEFEEYIHEKANENIYEYLNATDFGINYSYIIDGVWDRG